MYNPCLLPQSTFHLDSLTLLKKHTIIFGFYSLSSSFKLSCLSSLESSVSTRKCLPGLTNLEYSFVISWSEDRRVIEGCSNNKEIWFCDEKKGAN